MEGALVRGRVERRVAIGTDRRVRNGHETLQRNCQNWVAPQRGLVIY